MKALVLLTVPAVLACAYVCFEEVQEPCYLGSNSDPGYVYLLNSRVVLGLTRCTTGL